MNKYSNTNSSVDPGVSNQNHSQQKPYGHIRCQDCGISKVCLPAMLAEAEVAHLDSIVQRSTTKISKGTHIFNEGDDFKNIYAIRAGAFKTYINSFSGEEQITAFHLPGEVIGFDGLYKNKHSSSAVALIDSYICQIPYGMLDSLCSHMGGLRNQIMRLMSNEIGNDQEMLLLLGQKNANEKMAALLMNLSVRYQARKLSHDLFELPMSRSELANYLGLTIETVSRIIKIFKEKGYIEITGKHVYIKNMMALKRMAGIYCV